MMLTSSAAVILEHGRTSLYVTVYGTGKKSDIRKVIVEAGQ